MTETARCIAMLLLVGVNGVLDVVREHRDTLPEQERRFTVYLNLLPYEGDQQDDLATAIRLMVAASSRQQVIEHCVPVRLGASPVMAMNLQRLEWDAATYLKILEAYPYDETISQRSQLTAEERADLPNIIRADWLLVQLADGRLSQAYRNLLLPATKREGELVPVETLAECLESFGVSDERAGRFGHIAENSRVSKAGTRLLESRALPRGYCWLSYDSRLLTRESDPLENLQRDMTFDGQEILIWIPKVSRVTGDRGVAMLGFLADGNGRLVDEAPIDLVADYNRFRGFENIIAPSDCIFCHAKGTQRPTANAYRAYVGAGLPAFVPLEQLAETEGYHASNAADEWDRIDEDYARFVNVACGTTTDEACAAFGRAVEGYDRPVDLLRAALEMDCEVTALGEAIRTVELAGSRRVLALTAGASMSRAAFERQFTELREIGESLPPFDGPADSGNNPEDLTERTSDAIPTENEPDSN